MNTRHMAPKCRLPYFYGGGGGGGGGGSRRENQYYSCFASSVRRLVSKTVLFAVCLRLYSDDTHNNKKQNAHDSKEKLHGIGNHFLYSYILYVTRQIVRIYKSRFRLIFI